MIQKNRMYRISDNKVQDGLWDGIKRFFGGSDKPKEQRKKGKYNPEYEAGDTIKFKRQNGQSANGLVTNVYQNMEEGGIDYGVKTSKSVDNVVVPEENIIDSVDLAKRRMYRVSDNSEDTYNGFTSYKVSEDYGIEPAQDEKSLLEGIDAILKQITSRDTAAYKAAKYLEETPDVSKQWMQKKGIVSFDDFKKWCANRQSMVRRGVREERKEYDRKWAQMKAESDVNDLLDFAHKQYEEYEAYLNSDSYRY